MRPIVDIYSTFLQRSFDQIFQEVALQNLPVAFMPGPRRPDRAGRPDAPRRASTSPYLRLFPNLVVMAPGDEADVQPMLEFALRHDGPTSMRYPRRAWRRSSATFAPVELGKAEVIEWGDDGASSPTARCCRLRQGGGASCGREGLNVGVINARFAKPLDRETMLPAVEELPLVVTVEEGTLEGGFGSAVLEAGNAAGIDTRNVIRLGMPDRFIEHAERARAAGRPGPGRRGLVPGRPPGVRPGPGGGPVGRPLRAALVTGRTIAIGDIHGCSRALAALLDTVEPQPADTIITLGDHIDRGPDSYGVVNRLVRSVLLKPRRTRRLRRGTGGLESVL